MVQLGKTWIAVLAAALAMACTPLSSAEDANEAFAPYAVLDDAMAATEAAFDRALENDKRVLVILGANWCHDSMALARRMQNPALKDVLDTHYETVVVGVGYYEGGFDVAQRLGVAIYTHTPTVLIFDPSTDQLVNLEDHDIWREAARVSDDETLAYFKAKAEAPSSTPVSQATKAQNYPSALRAFETEQAARLRAAYAILGPKLEADADDLGAFWAPVRDFRYQFTDDLKTLRSQAREAQASGQPFTPNWPTYDPFPWEEGARE